MENFRKLLPLVFLLAVILASCNGLSRSSNINATNTVEIDLSLLYTDAFETVAAIYESSTPTPSPTLASTPSPTSTPSPWISPTPETLNGYPTPPIVMTFPTCNPNGDCFDVDRDIQRQALSFNELYLGKYVLRNWCDVDQEIYPPCAVTISSSDDEQVRLWGYPARFGKDTGADLTGNGKPDIVIIDWSGGNCCVGVIIYEVDDNLTKIMDVGIFRTGNFIDFDDNGTYEYVGYVRSFSGFCTECGYITLPIIYEYQDGFGYVAATDIYMSMLELDIQPNLDALFEFQEKYLDIQLQFDHQTLDSFDYCPAISSLYRLVAYHILTGQENEARDILNEYSVPELTSEYMIEFQKELEYMISP